MNNIVEYLNSLEKEYINCKNDEERLKYAIDIYLLAIALYNNKIIKLGEYYEITHKINTNDMNKLNEYYKNKNNIVLDQFKSVLEQDIEYLDYLLNSYIQVEYPVNNKTNINNISLKEYINNDQKFIKYYNKQEKNFYYNSKIKEAITIFLKSKNKSLFLINSYDPAHIIHEIMHDYSMGINQRYREMPSILLELGIQSKQNINFSYRLEQLKEFNKLINEKKYNKKNFNFINLSYGIGIIVSIPIIYKYGNEFNSLLNIVDFIIKNDNINVKNLLNELNITDNDINNSYKELKKSFKV